MTTTTDVELGTITRDDLEALRVADAVTFSYRPEVAGQIRVRLDSHNGRIFTAREQRLFGDADEMGRRRAIGVQTRMYGHGQDGTTAWNLSDSANTAAYVGFQSAQYYHVWRTIASLLRVGDMLTLSWVADNNNDNLRAAGLHRDELFLVVRRGDNTLHLHLQTSVCPNNTARMIRRHGA